MKWVNLCWIIGWFSLGHAQDLKIIDPVSQAYVSGAYEVVLDSRHSDSVIETRLYLNGVQVFKAEGWQAMVVIEFGDGTRAQALRAQVLTRDQQTYRSEIVRTRPLRIDYFETARAILISAVVKNRKGQHFTDLKRSQFQVFEDGHSLIIQSFHQENLPLDLVMVLDTSSSLREGIVDLKQAAVVFLGKLGPADLVGLIEIKNQPKKIQKFTNDHKLLLNQIDAMESMGQTALFDALNMALEVFPAKRRGRKTIVLFTDGRDSVHEEPSAKAALLRAIITRAQNNEITLFTVGLGKRVNSAALARLAEDTGGRFLFADRPQKLPEIFAEIILDLKHQYVLGVLPESRRSGFHRLEVRVKKKGVRVFSRKGYTLSLP